jgi:hypothetical protein
MAPPSSAILFAQTARSFNNFYQGEAASTLVKYYSVKLNVNVINMLHENTMLGALL